MLDYLQDPPTAPEDIPSLDDFKKLSLADMLAKLPLLRVGDSEFAYKVMMPCIICEDGTTVSVQASAFHYAHPRANRGPYKGVEVGFPSVEPPLAWEKYAEDWKNPTDTVYAYVPLELVSLFIASHGGINVDKTFEGFEFKAPLTRCDMLCYPIPLDGRCPECNTVDLCDKVTPNMDKALADMDIEKAARMRLLGEDKIYKQEYETCLERIQARERIAARRRSSNTKSTV